jgi:hypothetical protein
MSQYLAPKLNANLGAVAALRLESKRPNAQEWLTRNDRFRIGGYSSYHAAMQDAEGELRRWQIVEPNTQFRIINIDNVGREIHING